MKNVTDWFKAPTEKDLEEAEKQSTEQVNMAGECARFCLGIEAFQRYKRQYLLAQERMLSAMEMCTQAFMAGQFDITTYGAKQLVYMTRLKDLRMLLDQIETDSKKGKTLSGEDPQT